MKKLIILTLFLFLGIVSQAQIKNFKAEYVSLKLPQYTWSEWEVSDVIISLHLQKEIITIFSQKEQEYTIVSKEFLVEDEKTIKLAFLCIDEKGIKCSIEFVTFKNKEGKHLYIRKQDYEIVYQMKLIK